MPDKESKKMGEEPEGLSLLVAFREVPSKDNLTVLVHCNSSLTMRCYSITNSSSVLEYGYRSFSSQALLGLVGSGSWSKGVKNIPSRPGLPVKPKKFKYQTLSPAKIPCP